MIRSLILFVVFSLNVYGALPILPHPADDNLSSQFAVFRKDQVQSVAYDLRFEFKKESETYNGKAVLNVELNRVDAPLSIDFLWKKIHAIKVNEKLLAKYKTGKGHLEIPAQSLSRHLVIEVEYTNEFSQTGDGISKSKDPEDNSEYIATDFEPYMAHSLFPCFDQPDLKATYKVTTVTPKDWKAISNELADEKSENGEKATHYFKKTKPFSTYLFFLGVGPYEEWADKIGEIPLFLYARKSLAKHVDYERIFDVTKKGLRFYTEYFEIPFPFSKYGQIFIPEFSWGGMENPGAVALQEKNIFRETVSKTRMDGRDNLILHEMAHMWFGDLVTMKWWNDLWLNESFASFIAAVAMEQAMGSKSAWLDFAGDKGWGYWQDQLVTSHPIETVVLDTRTARGNFDGITYAKGAASLKQLHFFVGENGFRKGLTSYFRKFAFQNSTRQDFIFHISKGAATNLDSWVKSWLQTSGPNRVQVDWGCRENKISHFLVNQSPSSSGTLSPHRTKIGLYNYSSMEILKIEHTLEVAYHDKLTEVPALIGKSCPDFVYANLEDQDYALFSLDPTSLLAVKKSLARGFEDPLLRLMLWMTLGQMVRDGALSPQDYFETVLTALEAESEEMLLGLVLTPHGTVHSQYTTYLTPKQRALLALKFENLIWKRLEDSKPGSNGQLIFIDFFISIAQTKESLDRLAQFLEGKFALKGMELGPERRWSIIKALSRNGDPRAKELILAEEKRDPSTTGTRSAYAARVAFPNLADKTKYWNEFQLPKKLGYNLLDEGSAEFHHENFPEIAASFIKPFFKKVSTLDWKANDNLVSIYFENLFPSNLCTKDFLKESEAALKRSRNLTSLARRAWLEANDELIRCVKVLNPAK
ncbi:MAG: aminopeptidase N [Bdellovibrionales bacterium GWA2_49_15]|nr:MAG: aminopeptidase N [Bdellovibrionales bacterium GWA2_49_15]HAZ13420.1 aminopeptidase N [Bdellovibrionales bacterium]